MTHFPEQLFLTGNHQRRTSLSNGANLNHFAQLERPVLPKTRKTRHLSHKRRTPYQMIVLTNSAGDTKLMNTDILSEKMLGNIFIIT